MLVQSARRPRPAAPRGSFLVAWSALFVALAAGLLLPSCRQGRPAVRKQTRLMMDTYVTISAVAPGPQAGAGIDSAFVRLEQISHKFNHPFLLFKGEGIKFSLTPNWEKPVHSPFDQVVGQFSKGLHIDLPISRHRSHHGRNDPFRLEIHLYPLDVWFTLPVRLSS